MNSISDKSDKVKVTCSWCQF